MLDTREAKDVMGRKFAQGWYLICWSHELGADKPKPLKYFGKQFVLFRGANGQPVLLDAFCPHLGAHLGHGGRIEGDELVCPFHEWRFNTAGRCTKVPYAPRVPNKAVLGAYPVREHSGMILGYFAADTAAPSYEVPELPEVDHPEWTALQTAQIEIKTQAREVIENIADLAHFMPVHNTRIHDFKVVVDGPRATQRSVGRGRNLEGKKIDMLSVATYHGPAVQFTHLDWAYPMVLINAHIAIDENTLLLRFGVALKPPPGVTLSPEHIEAHVAAARDGYFQDVAIWENKCWRDVPVLAEGDGPIRKIRKWYASFFSRDIAERTSADLEATGVSEESATTSNVVE